MSTTDTSPQLAAALLYGALGWPVVPLFTPTDGVCDCPQSWKDADRCTPGKHPRTRNGLDDASTDEAAIRRWWGMWPHANIGVDLARAGLVDIAPDSLEWFAEFTARGLPKTLSFASGGGEGHAHHLYARPEGCAIHRDCQTGKYDVMSNGYAVMPPSLHASGRRYTWLEPADGIVLSTASIDVPDWGAAMLTHRPRTAPSAHERDEDAPPVTLSSDGLERWYGRLYETKPDGSVDRSYSLWWLAVFLLEAGCRARFVEDLLAERDLALGWHKFSSRDNAIERYSVIVERALESQGPGRVRLNGTAKVEVSDAHRTFIITNLATVQPERVEWLWQDRVPLGKLTLLDGDPGLGKSLITLDIAARLSRGHAMPDGSHAFAGVAGAVLLSAEDGIADTIRPRMEAAGGDPARIVVLEGIVARKGALPAMPSLEDLDAIEAAVRSVDARLVVVDPIMAYLPVGVSAFKDQEVRRMLGPLVTVIARLGVALICIRHLNKNTDTPSLYRGGGTIGFAGAARSVMLVGKDPNDTKDTIKVLARQKGNLAPPWRSVTYELIVDVGAEQPHIRWGKESDLRVDDLLGVRKAETPEGTSQLAEATEYLQETLKDGARAATEMLAEAAKLGISKSTLNRAKPLAGVKSVPRLVDDERHWYWSIPKNLNDETRPYTGNLGDLGDLEILGSGERGQGSQESQESQDFLYSEGDQ